MQPVRRSRAAEERVGHRVVGLADPTAAEEDAHRRLAEGGAGAHRLGRLAHEVLDGPLAGVLLDDAQHPLGLLVVGRELGRPVGDVTPLRVGEEGGGRDVERVGVDERAAADPGTGQDDDVLERMDPLDAVPVQPRHPQVAAQPPRGPREVFVAKAPAGLQHQHVIALLGQSKRRDAAAEAGAHDHHVVVEPVRSGAAHGCSSTYALRPVTVLVTSPSMTRLRMKRGSGRLWLISSS